MGIRVACALYKLVRGAKYFQYSNLFAIGKSIMYLVLQNLIFSIHVVFKSQIQWPKEEDLAKVMMGFRTFYSLPFIHNAIYVTYIHIQKPWGAFVGDYFSFKSKVYNMQLACMMWLIIKRSFKMFLWDYLVWWMMFTYYAFWVCIWRQWMETCFISTEVRKKSNLTWLLTSCTLYFLGDDST